MSSSNHLQPSAPSTSSSRQPSRSQSPLAFPGSRTNQHHQPSGLCTPTTGSQTVTIDPTATANPTLTLRGAHSPRQRRRIQWSTSVIDNEHLGRKKSKVCCIYHKTRDVGESSSEDDSNDDSSASGSGADSEGGHDHGGGEECRHGHSHGKRTRRTGRKASPNAYEKQPRAKRADGAQTQKGNEGGS